MKRCLCGREIKTKEAHACQSCRTLPYKKVKDRIIEAKIRKNNTPGKREEG